MGDKREQRVEQIVKDLLRGRRLKLRHIEILLAVVETGSMAKAGTRLSISQPAISRSSTTSVNSSGAARP